MSRILGALLAVLVLSLSMQARSSVKIRKSQFDLKSAPNVLLVTFDTTRADHLSCYGYARRTSPNIDRLASHGVLFENFYSAIPLTGPAHISLMSSLYPQQHGATINGMHMSTHPRPVLLAQIFRHLGYKTAAFISAWPLKKNITGLGRGFEVYNEAFSYHYKVVNSARTGDLVGAVSRRWLEKHAHSRFFLWVHYFDPHEPYELHSNFAQLPAVSHPQILPVSDSSDPEAAGRIRAYDSEIAFDDDDLGKTLKLLDDLDVRDQTLIVVVADHGEGLGEHQYWGHGDHIYQSVMHIPLIISYPKQIPQGGKIKRNASLVDVTPTILDYVGLHFHLPGQAGQSLRPLIEQSDQPGADRPTYFLTYAEPQLLPPQWMSWVWSWAETKRSPSELGFVQGDVKVVSNGDSSSLNVFHLDDAFSRAEPVSIKKLDVAQITRYREQIDTWFKRTNRGLQPEGKLTQEDLEMLRSLGYAQP